MEKELKYFKLVKELNDKFHDLLIENKVHYRANINSFSLISVSKEKPELGTKCKISLYKSEENWEKSVLNDIEIIKSIPIPPSTLSKPEKELQAHIINLALNNNYELAFDKDIHFISSEIAIKNNAGKKIVTDILGYNKKTQELCVIELKYDRQEKRLIEQVNNFESIINEKPEFFSHLLNIHGFTHSNSVPLAISKIVVWPYNKTSPKVKLKMENIIEVTFTPDYLFEKYS